MMITLYSVRSDAADILIACLALGICILLLFVAGKMVQKRLNESSGGSADAAPFTLSDLRMLHQRGQLTDEEFERAKSAMISKGLATLGNTAPQDGDGADSHPPGGSE